MAAGRNTSVSAAVLYSNGAKARTTSTSVSAVYASGGTIRLTTVALAVIYDPAAVSSHARTTTVSVAVIFAQPIRATWQAGGLGGLSWVLAPPTQEFRADGVTRVCWSAPAGRGPWNVNASATVAWGAGIGSPTTSWECDGRTDVDWGDPAVGGPVEWHCDGHTDVEWITRTGGVGTKCLSGDGQPAPSTTELNYVF